jgi:hypothetical protein
VADGVPDRGAQHPITGAILPSSEYFVPDSSGYVLSAADVRAWHNALGRHEKQSTFNFGGYDRIVNIANVMPNTTSTSDKLEEVVKSLDRINLKLSNATDAYTKRFVVDSKAPATKQPQYWNV